MNKKIYSFSFCNSYGNSHQVRYCSRYLTVTHLNLTLLQKFIGSSADRPAHLHAIKPIMTDTHIASNSPPFAILFSLIHIFAASNFSIELCLINLQRERWGGSHFQIKQATQRNKVSAEPWKVMARRSPGWLIGCCWSWSVRAVLHNDEMTERKTLAMRWDG